MLQHLQQQQKMLPQQRWQAQRRTRAMQTRPCSRAERRRKHTAKCDRSCGAGCTSSCNERRDQIDRCSCCCNSGGIHSSHSASPRSSALTSCSMPSGVPHFTFLAISHPCSHHPHVHAVQVHWAPLLLPSNPRDPHALILTTHQVSLVSRRLCLLSHRLRPFAAFASISDTSSLRLAGWPRLNRPQAQRSAHRLVDLLISLLACLLACVSFQLTLSQVKSSHGKKTVLVYLVCRFN